MHCRNGKADNLLSNLKFPSDGSTVAKLSGGSETDDGVQMSVLFVFTEDLLTYNWFSEVSDERSCAVP